MYSYVRFLFVLIIIQTFLFANKNTVVTGDVTYYYMQRLKDQSLVNIPFRMINLNVIHQNKNFDVNGNFALEYRNRKDSDFMQDSDPSDIIPIVRELYLTYLLDNGEISLGKKIYTWGNVDENSPIDIINAHDNYYLLIGTSERKLGTYSISFDYYINNGSMKLTGIYSPMHNANRYPINDEEYEFGLPISIQPSQIIDIEKPAEFGLSIQQSFSRGDFSISYFRGYNRTPGFSGFNEYIKLTRDSANDNWENLESSTKYLDLVYSYHLTQVANLGGVILFDDFTIRFDYGMFNTKDDNAEKEYSEHECGMIGAGAFYGFTCDGHNTGDNPNLYKYEVNSSHPLKQQADYSQQTFQLEIPLSDNYQINMQYFKYSFDDDSFNYDDPLDEGVTLQIPNLDLPEGCDVNDLETCLYFTPGMGAPFAMISSETFYISLEKYLFDNDLKLTLGTLMDLDRGFGELATFEADYNLGNGLNIIAGITKVIGDNEVENYIFNEIEDFSNMRFEIKYNF